MKKQPFRMRPPLKCELEQVLEPKEQLYDEERGMTRPAQWGLCGFELFLPELEQKLMLSLFTRKKCELEPFLLALKQELKKFLPVGK